MAVRDSPAYMPYRENAVVEWTKLYGYLLNVEHEKAADRARRLAQYGYTQENGDLLKAELIRVAQTAEVVEVDEKPYGIRYVFEEDIATPVGRPLYLRMVWQVDRGNTIPRFISAYPIRRRIRKEVKRDT